MTLPREVTKRRKHAMKNRYPGLLCRRTSIALLFELLFFAVGPSAVRAAPSKSLIQRYLYTSERQTGLLEGVDASSVSSNLIKSPPAFTPQSVVVAQDGSVVVAGLSSTFLITVTNFASDGREDWSTTIGNASSRNEVNCLTTSGSALYVGGTLAVDIDEDRKAGAFVSRLDSNGDVDWTTSFGTMTSGDAIHAIAVDGSTVYAGGSVGTLSTLFETAPTDSNILRPLLVKLTSTSGKIQFESAPTPQDNEIEELITGVGVDSKGVLYAGGRFGRVSDDNSPVVYRFNGSASQSTFVVKNGHGLTHFAISSSTGEGRFFAVGGCYMHRVENSGNIFTVRTNMLEDDGKCIGEARGVQFRESDESIVVVTEDSAKAEILLYANATGSLVGRVSGSSGQASGLVGPSLLGEETVALAGRVGTSSELYVGGAIVKRVTAETKDGSIVDSNSVEGKNADDSNKLWVKVAAIGGSAAVVFIGIVLTVVIVQYVKRTGDPA